MNVDVFNIIIYISKIFDSIYNYVLYFLFNYTLSNHINKLYKFTTRTYNPISLSNHELT